MIVKESCDDPWYAPLVADTPQNRLDVAKQIVELFRWERFTYLAVSLLTALIVILVGLQARKDNAPISDLSLLFGSGGIIAFNVSRLLTMFNTVLGAVFKADKDAVGDN